VSPNEPRLLCVSIHDVAPATWAECERLARALRQVADIDLTWLVVPHYHGRDDADEAMRAGLDGMLARGDELALHGYQHRDDQPLAGDSLRGRFLRGVYTTREGEFSALPLDEARRRIRLGLDWFAARGWPVSGFVPPAWLLGEQAWQALREFPFTYVTTFSRFHLLPGRQSCFSPSLVYAARNRAGRVVSPLAAGALASLLARAPLIRLSLHPPDVRHPRLVSHAQRLVEHLLATRTAVTKAACAQALTSTDPRTRRANGPDPSPRST
jgi:predicted deacetylase